MLQFIAHRRDPALVVVGVHLQRKADAVKLDVDFRDLRLLLCPRQRRQQQRRQQRDDGDDDEQLDERERAPDAWRCSLATDGGVRHDGRAAHEPHCEPSLHALQPVEPCLRVGRVHDDASSDRSTSAGTLVAGCQFAAASPTVFVNCNW